MFGGEPAGGMPFGGNGGIPAGLKPGGKPFGGIGNPGGSGGMPRPPGICGGKPGGMPAGIPGGIPGGIAPAMPGIDGGNPGMPPCGGNPGTLIPAGVGMLWPSAA